MAHPKLTLDDIPALFSDTIYQRGRNYYAIGAVYKIMLRDDLLLAEVEGSEEEYYKVVIQFEKNQISTADCSCPYGESFIGYCKHIAATLLTYVDKPEDVIYAESVATILEPLSDKQLRGALEHLLALYPEAIDRLELYLKPHKS